MFELALSALNTPTGRRSNGTSLMQSNSLYRLVLDEFNVERQPLYVRGKYRQEDMTLWMKRPLSNVLLNAAIFHVCYLLPLFHRLRQKMMRPIIKNTQKRWHLALQNNCINRWDLNLNSFVSIGNPLSFWRLPNSTDSAASKDIRSFQEKLRNSSGEEHEKSERRSLPNPSMKSLAVDKAVNNIESRAEDKPKRFSAEGCMRGKLYMLIC